MLYGAFSISFFVVLAAFLYLPFYKERGLAACFGCAFSIVSFIVLIVLLKQGTNASLVEHSTLIASLISPVLYFAQLLIRYVPEVLEVVFD